MAFTVIYAARLTRVDRSVGDRFSEAIMKISKVETFLVRWGDVTRPVEADFGVEGKEPKLAV